MTPIKEVKKPVNFTNRPKKGDVIVVHGDYKIVKSVARYLVTFEDETKYYIQSLMKVGAYYL